MLTCKVANCFSHVVDSGDGCFVTNFSTMYDRYLHSLGRVVLYTEYQGKSFLCLICRNRRTVVKDQIGYKLFKV